MIIQNQDHSPLRFILSVDKNRRDNDDRPSLHSKLYHYFKTHALLDARVHRRPKRGTVYLTRAHITDIDFVTPHDETFTYDEPAFLATISPFNANNTFPDSLQGYFKSERRMGGLMERCGMTRLSSLNGMHITLYGMDSLQLSPEYQRGDINPPDSPEPYISLLGIDREDVLSEIQKDYR